MDPNTDPKQLLLGIVLPEKPHFLEMQFNSVELAPRSGVLRLAEGLNSGIIVGRSSLLTQQFSLRLSTKTSPVCPFVRPSVCPSARY